jgi:hypothetical protein
VKHNPYSPPAAAVADAPETPGRPMPSAVRRALYLFVTSFLLNLAISIVSLRYPEANAYAGLSAMALAVSIVIELVILVWLGWKIAVGRNWARVVLLVLTIVSVPAGFLEVLQVAPIRPILAGLKLVEQGIDIAVVYLLFFPAREYFKPARSVP